jgi:hypothetical protein
MPDLRRKDHTHGARAAGVLISERDPQRQFERALNAAVSLHRRSQEKFDKAIEIGQKILEASKT